MRIPGCPLTHHHFGWRPPWPQFCLFSIRPRHAEVGHRFAPLLPIPVVCCPSPWCGAGMVDGRCDWFQLIVGIRCENNADAAEKMKFDCACNVVWSIDTQRGMNEWIVALFTVFYLFVHLLSLVLFFHFLSKWTQILLSLQIVNVVPLSLSPLYKFVP